MAYDASNNLFLPPTNNLTSFDGTYSLMVKAGQIKVYFDASVKPLSGLRSQFYKNQNSLESAGVVTVQRELTTANIDASLTFGGGKISVHVINTLGQGVPAGVYLFDAKYYSRIKVGTKTDDNGFLEIDGLNAGDYKLTAYDSRDGLGQVNWEWYDSRPTFATAMFVTVSEGGNTHILIVLGDASSTIDGMVTFGGSPLANVVMNGLPNNPLTNASGVYSAAVDYNWSGTVTPTLAGYIFSPVDRTYTNVTANQTTQDYTASVIPDALTVTAPNGGENLDRGRQP